MEGHLLCNGVFSDAASLSLSFLCPHVSANTHIHIYFREASLGTTWRTILHLPWCNGGRVTDGMGRNGREIKRQYGAMEAGPKEGGQRQRESGGTNSEWFTHLVSETSCDKSSRVALSVFSCVFACGECGPVRLRGNAGRYSLTAAEPEPELCDHH